MQGATREFEARQLPLMQKLEASIRKPPFTPLSCCTGWQPRHSKLGSTCSRKSLWDPHSLRCPQRSILTDMQGTCRSGRWLRTTGAAAWLYAGRHGPMQQCGPLMYLFAAQNKCRGALRKTAEGQSGTVITVRGNMADSTPNAAPVIQLGADAQALDSTFPCSTAAAS